MKEIPLGHGRIALVDDDDYETLSARRWHATRARYALTFYAQSTIPSDCPSKKGSLLMHRVIMGAGPGQQVDHRDGNGLNNQRHNLRYATYSQNSANQPPASDNTSGFRGVSFDKSCGKWKAYIRHNGKLRHLGLFLTAEEASAAHQVAAKAAFGEFCYFARPAALSPSPAQQEAK